MSSSEQVKATLSPASQRLVDQVMGDGFGKHGRDGEVREADGAEHLEQLVHLLELLPTADPDEELVDRTVRRVKRAEKSKLLPHDPTSDSNYLYLQL